MDAGNAGQADADARVLRSFLRDGRLTSIPAQHAKRLAILRWLLATRFPDDGPWEEREVNMRLALVHPDVAALRRYLVDAGLMVRRAGIYRKAADAASAALSVSSASSDPPGGSDPPGPAGAAASGVRSDRAVGAGASDSGPTADSVAEAPSSS